MDFTLCQFKYQPQILDYRFTCPQNKSHDTCESSELFSYLNELEALCPLPPQPPFVSLSPLLWSRPSVVLVSFLCPSPKCEARSTSVAAIAAKAFPPRDKTVQQFRRKKKENLPKPVLSLWCVQCDLLLCREFGDSLDLHSY